MTGISTLQRWARATPAACMAIAMSVWLTACGGSDDPAVPPPAPPPSEGSATIGAAGGFVDGPDLVRLGVPPGAVDSDVTFRIARDGSGAPPLPGGIDLLSAVYAITPHGQVFNQPVAIRVPSNVAQAAGRPTFLMKAEPGGRWAVIGTDSGSVAALTASIDSLSYVAVGACTNNLPPNSPFAQNCPTSNVLRFELLTDSGDPFPVSQDTTYSAIQPVLLVTTPTVLTGRITWTRAPFAAARVDTLDTGSRFSGTATGVIVERQFGIAWSAEAPEDREVTQNITSTFTITVTPAQVFNARNVNGVVRPLWAQARAGDWEYNAVIPIRIRDVSAPPPSPAPTITQQPANAGVVEGQPASFSVAASITPAAALTYQWSRRADTSAAFAPIVGATAATFNLATTALTDNGAQFQVVVCAAPTRCVSSSPATLTVARAPLAPSFTLQPASIAVVAGQTASFTVTATGNPLPRIDWQSAPASDPNNFTSLSVAPNCVRTDPPASGTSTAATCTVGPLAIGDSGRRYRAAATNSVTTTISTVATLTVSPAPVPPTITQQPQPQTTTVGGSATFSVTATGTAPLSYAWGTLNGGSLPSVNGNFTIGSCTGQITYSDGGATVTLSNLTVFCSGFTVTVTVSNGVNPSATSGGATLTVTPVTQGLSLLAGDIGGPGVVDGSRAQARVATSPRWGIAFDVDGNAYFNDGIAGRVRKVTPTGTVSTFTDAGATFRGNDGGIAVDSSGNLYFPERSVGNRVLRMTPAGVISVWLSAADGWANQVASVAMDAAGNLYGAEGFTGQPQRIVKITPARVVSTFYTFADATGSVNALAVDGDGNLYGSGSGSLFGTVVRITPAGVLSIVAGAAGEQGSVDGTGPAARFFGIGGLAMGTGGFLYATDNRAVRRIRLLDAEVATVSGFSDTAPPRDGFGTTARYESPGSIAAAPSGELLIGDYSTLRRLSTTDFYAATFVGKVLSTGSNDGNGATARFVGPAGVALDSSGNAYVADVGSGVRKVTPGGVVTTLIAAIRPRMLGRDANGDLVAASSNAIWRVSLSGTATLLAGNPAESGYLDAAVGTDARFGQILGLAIDGAGNVFVSENINQNSTIRRITPQGAVTTWAGMPGDFGAGDGEADGDRLSARFRSPKGLAFDSNGNLFVADFGNRTIRRISPAGVVSTVAGTAQAIGTTDGTGAAARFMELGGLAIGSGDNLLIADFGTLRRMTPAGVVTTAMGLPGLPGVRLGSQQPQLNRIGGIAVRPDGRVVLTSEAAVLEATLP